MASSTHITLIFTISHLILQVLAKHDPPGINCPSTFQCATLGTLGYPFTTNFNSNCGLYVLNCTEPVQKIGLTKTGPWYDILGSFASNRSYLVGDQLLLNIVNDECDVIEDSFRFPRSSSVEFTVLLTKTLWNCPRKFDVRRANSSGTLRRLTECSDHNVYHSNITVGDIPGCEIVLYPTHLMVELSAKCSQCVSESGVCQDSQNDGFRCINKAKERRRRRLILGLGISLGSSVILIIALVCWYLKKANFESLALTSWNITPQPRRMMTDLEGSKVYFSVPIFSYTELEQATNNFDPNRELGDGGFGTVYYGKLKDGREVAVKRLYERNSRRIEQFMNEVEILAGLRHQNLVSLYGCTSQRSEELLLVYEYVSNGTVSDHLTGDQSKFSLLPWPTRLNITIETANALSYLHASDIIHRDVKSNNILLDKNFSVKIADFGLSRLFPLDMTHISTAPQGTPGYLDPEYYNCYQLTDKSDVYSFGVVLVELISSLPAIDMDRDQDEINLSNYAMKRIQRGGIDELVDSRLGFKTDENVKRMITLVAELAFQCLQQKKELRPSMVEIIEELKMIKATVNEEMKSEIVSEIRTDQDCMSLLRNTEYPASPSSVMEKWGSSTSVTPTTSK